jgi:hypothetical protein
MIIDNDNSMGTYNMYKIKIIFSSTLKDLVEISGTWNGSFKVQVGLYR